MQRGEINMGIFRLIKALSKSGLLSIESVTELSRAIRQQGVNVMALLHFAVKKYGERTAIIHSEKELTYGELFTQSMQLAHYFSQQHDIKPNMRIGIHCRNDVALVKVIFALSRLGAKVYFLNTEMGNEQCQQVVQKHQFDLFIYDDSLKSGGIRKQALCIYDIPLHPINDAVTKLEKTSTSNFILLTSGTTGIPKEVVHKPSLFRYLPPVIGLVEQLRLLEYKSGYIATPLYHGYGLAILFLLLALGKKVILTDSFNAKQACSLIAKHEVEIVTVVPLMIHKMLAENLKSQQSLRCIASGGAMLSPHLVNEVTANVGEVLYNLYGTSETGLNLIATPSDLAYAPHTIGRGIKGIDLKIVEANEQGIGQLWVKSKAGMVNPHHNWLPTGDLAYQDNNGYYFLAGRQDDLVVSAGENVYPVQLENTLLAHPFIEDVAVIGVHDEQFGQRLQAFVQLKAGKTITQDSIVHWLKTKVARYEMPKHIIFLNSIPYTNLGKKDKKQLTHIKGSEYHV